MNMRHAAEQEEQEALFAAITAHSGKYPDLALAFHVPNEGCATVAYRAKMKRQGLRAGLPDLLLPVPCQGRSGVAWIGLAIELKTKTGRLQDHQKWWLIELAKRGWKTDMCRGWEAAWALIKRYVEGDV